MDVLVVAGPIPTELGALPNLRKIALGDNNLTGKLFPFKNHA